MWKVNPDNYNQFVINLRKNKIPKFENILLFKIPPFMIAYFVGLLIKPLGRHYNVKVANEGVNYYGEVHTSTLNRYIHTVGMPFTIYGMTQWIPALFNLNPKNSQSLLVNLYLIYFAHYFSINYKIGFLYSLVYTPITVTGIVNHYKNKTPNQKFLNGFAISALALFLQETLGHYMGGDKQSRIEAIPNAILYAKYFSLHHIINLKQKWLISPK